MAGIEDLAIQIQELAKPLESSATKASEELHRLNSLYRQIPAETVKDILRDLRFAQIPRSDTDVALQAYATIFLRKLGVLDRDGASQGVVDRLLQPLVLSGGN